jgi:hypothetical protein
VILGWQESYLDNSDRPSARYTLGDTPALAPSGVIGCKHRGPHHGPLKIFVTCGSALGNTGVMGDGAGGAKGADVTGAGGVGDASVGWEQCYPFTGHAHSGGAWC